MAGEKTLPQYLHRPLMLIFFEVDEWFVALVFYYFANMFGGYLWWGVVVAPWVYRKVKINRPRGFLWHLLYQSGFYEMDFVPMPLIQFFEE